MVMANLFDFINKHLFSLALEASFDDPLVKTRRVMAIVLVVVQVWQNWLIAFRGQAHDLAYGVCKHMAYLLVAIKFLSEENSQYMLVLWVQVDLLPLDLVPQRHFCDQAQE